MHENEEINKKLNVPAVFMMAKLPKKKKPEKRFVCGYEWKPFEKMSVGYLPAIPQIVIDVAKKECSEGQACLNVSCQFNKTTFNTYCDIHDEPAEYRPYFLKKWPKLIQYRQDLVEAAEKCKKAYEADTKKLRIYTIESVEIKKQPGMAGQPRQPSNIQELSASKKDDCLANSTDKEQNGNSELK